MPVSGLDRPAIMLKGWSSASADSQQRHQLPLFRVMDISASTAPSKDFEIPLPLVAPCYFLAQHAVPGLTAVFIGTSCSRLNGRSSPFSSIQPCVICIPALLVNISHWGASAWYFVRQVFAEFWLAFTRSNQLRSCLGTGSLLPPGMFYGELVSCWSASRNAWLFRPLRGMYCWLR